MFAASDHAESTVDVGEDESATHLQSLASARSITTSEGESEHPEFADKILPSIHEKGRKTKPNVPRVMLDKVGTQEESTAERPSFSGSGMDDSVEEGFQKVITHQTIPFYVFFSICCLSNFNCFQAKPPSLQSPHSTSLPGSETNTTRSKLSTARNVHVGGNLVPKLDLTGSAMRSKSSSRTTTPGRLTGGRRKPTSARAGSEAKKEKTKKIAFCEPTCFHQCIIVFCTW